MHKRVDRDKLSKAAMMSRKIVLWMALAATCVVGHARADVVYPNTSWFSIPGENSADASAMITTTAPHDGNGSVELTGDRTRYTNGNYYSTTGTGLYALSNVTALTFAWRVASDSSNPYNPDYTPALRLHIYDPSTGKRSELIWEGAYNNVYGNETKDTWYSTTMLDLFYQNVSGAGVTFNNGSQVNQTVSNWKSSYSSSAVVTALSVGDGSGASAAYHAFADDVTIFFTDSSSTLFNFEVGSTAVPEPASFVLLGAGLIGLRLAGRRRSKASQSNCSTFRFSE